MAKTVVNPKILMDTSREIEGKASEYRSSYQQFYNEVENLKTKWKGDAVAKAAEQFGRFEDDFDRMYDLMMDYADYLRNAANAYDQANEKIIGEAAALRVDY